MFHSNIAKISSWNIWLAKKKFQLPSFPRQRRNCLFYPVMCLPPRLCQTALHRFENITGIYGLHRRVETGMNLQFCRASVGASCWHTFCPTAGYASHGVPDGQTNREAQGQGKGLVIKAEGQLFLSLLFLSREGTSGKQRVSHEVVNMCWVLGLP